MNRFLSKVLHPLETSDYKKIFLIFTLTSISALLELLGIGLIIPILQIFVDGEFRDYVQNFTYFSEKSKENILVTILFILGALYLIKFFLLRFLIFIQFNFCHKLYTRISRKFFKNYLYKNYLFHTQNNSSELIRNVIGEGNLFS